MGAIIYRKRRNKQLSGIFNTHGPFRIIVAEYKCVWWPSVMTIAFVATRDHAMQRYRERYGNLPPCRRWCVPSPVDYRAFIVPLIGREWRLIAIASSWGAICYWKNSVSRSRISRLLIFNKAESSRRVGFQRPPFTADSKLETIEGEEKRCWSSVGRERVRERSSNPETMVVVSCWSVDKLGERELLWKHARMAFVTVADCLVCSFPVYIPYRGSGRLPIREKIVLFFSPSPLSFLSF